MANTSAPPVRAGFPSFLTRVEQIRRLTKEQAARGNPVRIQAVVTYYAASTGDLFVQDSSAGIWVNVPPSAPRLRAGQVIALEGVTEAPDFAPQIGQPRYRVIGEAPLPRPRRVSLERMLSTVEDGQWVEVDGIVRRAGPVPGNLVLEVAVAGGRLKAFIPEAQSFQADRIVDAAVRLRGVCGAAFNRNNQLIGVVLYVPSLAQLHVRRPPPADPFAETPQPIAMLQHFAPERALGHRVRVQGIVTLQDGEKAVYICDGKHGIRIESDRPVRFQPGDQLDVVGFPRVSGFGLVVEDALCQRTGATAAVTPRPVSAQQVLDGDYDSLPVSIEGRLLEKSFSSGISTMVLRSGTTIFDASLQQAQKVETLPPSRAHLRLTGICLTNRDEDGRTRSFRLLLESQDNIRTTRSPSWWTAQRARGALEGLSLVILAVGAWVISLRRRVRGQIAVIRQRLEREAALEQRFHSLLDNANDIIFTADLQGVLTSVNKAGERISGYTQQELVDVPLSALFAAESQEAAEAIRSVVRDQSYSAGDWAVARKDGSRAQVEVSLQAIQEGGQPAGILGIARDISDRKRMEHVLVHARQLAGARDAAEEASRAKSTFLANISHELRTPLNAIIGYSQMLQEDSTGPGQEEVRADLEKIERAGHILLGIINDILDLSKIEAGRETVKPQNIDVALVLEDVCNAVRPLARQQGNVLEIDCPEHARLAYADLSKFRQSVLNLVNNACKFTEQGRVSVAVNKLRNAQGEWTEVHVSDTGAGIAAEHLNKLFHPFCQVDSPASRKHSGTGLGLAISKKFCQMMGGDITVWSEAGRGSRFSIRVPAGRSEPGQALKEG